MKPLYIKKNISLFILCFCLFQFSYSQDFLMQNGSTSICAGNFYDSGGLNNAYNSNEDLTYTICPDLPDYKSRAEFTGIAFPDTTDVLMIYDGQDINSTLLATFDFNDNITPSDNSIIISASDSNLSGCLTFRFISDGFINGDGWSAELSCFENCEDTTATLVQVTPPNFNTATAQYEVTIFESFMVEIDPLFTANNGNNPTYLWDFGDGNGVQTTSQPNITYAFDVMGDFNLNISIIDDFQCTNDNLLQIPFMVVGPNNNYCSTAREICFDEPIINLSNFNSLNGGLPNAEMGPDYECLASQPFPSWFYFKVQQSGDLTFLIEQNSSEDFTGTFLDIDFKIWGPFSTPFGNCNNLNPNTEVPDLPNGSLFDGCSFSAAPIENMGVENAQVGEFYVFVTTNFNQNQGFIRLQQININDPNAGQIECSDNLLGEDVEICELDPVTLTCSVSNALSYVWEKFNPTTGIYDLLIGETFSSISVAPPGGLYRLTADDGIEILQDEITVEFNDFNVADKPNDIITCDDTGDNTAIFDLTSNIPGIIGSSNTNIVVTFYETQSDADNSTNTIQNVSNYVNTTNPQTIYYRAEDASTGCFLTGTFDLLVDCLGTAQNDIDLNNLNLYPNPSKDKIVYIKNVSSNLKIENISMFDINGKLVEINDMTSTQNATIELNLNHMSSGLYLLQIETKDNSIAKKVILE